MADESKKKQREDWALTEEEIAQASKELIQQVKGALKDVRDPIGGCNVILNVAMNLHAQAMSGIAKYTSLQGAGKDKMLKDLYQSYCDGHKQIMTQIEPEVAKKLYLTVAEPTKLHLT